MTGEKIREARQKIGITQKELAERMGTSPQNLAQYENGKRQPKLETLDKIAAALGIDVWELYEGYELPENDKEFENAWENLLIMSDILFMTFEDHTGKRGKIFAIDDDRFKYFLTTDQCEKLPGIVAEQIKTLIKAMAEEPFKKEK